MHFILTSYLMVTVFLSFLRVNNEVYLGLSGRENTILDCEILTHSNLETDQNLTIMGERIDGPANIRDTINGRLLFTLYDNTQVSCTPLVNNWYRVGVRMDVDREDSGTLIVKVGDIIKVGGVEVGVVQSEMTIYTRSDGLTHWGEIIGYTYNGNIKSSSIIELVFKDYMQELEGQRSVEEFQPFIDSFNLATSTGFKGYQLFYKYENWLDDPSPMYRLGLVFQDNLLVAVLHSRPLQIAGMTDHILERGFSCMTVNGVDHTEEIVSLFTDFVRSVD